MTGCLKMGVNVAAHTRHIFLGRGSFLEFQVKTKLQICDQKPKLKKTKAQQK